MYKVCIVQARMLSTRLPGKSAMTLAGKPLIYHVLRRVKQAKNVDEVVLALPRENADHRALVGAAADAGCAVVTYLGGPDDLVGRYNWVAGEFKAGIVIRVPGDNPCVDPDEVDRAVNLFTYTMLDKEERLKPCWQNLVTTLDRDVDGNGYPGGIGAEVYSRVFLTWLDHNTHSQEHREHPHRWAFDNKRIYTMHANHAFSKPHLRFDVNTESDLAYVRRIYDGLGEDFRIRDILKFLGESNGQ